MSESESRLRDLAELERWARQVMDALDGRPLPVLPDEAPARIKAMRDELLKLREAGRGRR